MRIRHLKIENFRGIKALDWTVPDGLSCLIGPGDSTKTTILDAVELALLPRWAVALDDADFFSADTRTPIVIEVTIGDLPLQLRSQNRFGMELRGWTKDGKVVDEPGDDDESVLTIRFTADDSLEPRWLVVNERNSDGRPISHRDRALLGSTRLGGGSDRQFTWGTGTLLARLSDNERASQELAAAARTARANADLGKVQGLKESVDRVVVLAKKMGLSLRAARAHLDPSAVSLRSGAMALHEGEVPIRRSGLGSRMLLLLAMQVELARAGAIGLVDEIEQGLEPHRLRAVLRALKKDGGQMLVTSHAPVAVHEMGPSNTVIVRNHSGTTTARSVPMNLRPFLLKSTDTLLARKVLVCEGMTELGFCRHLDERWGGAGTTFAIGGVALCYGNGSEAPQIALNFRSLGYDVLVFGDSDRATSPKDGTLEGKGIKVWRWPAQRALEDQVVHDLPWLGLVALVELACSFHGGADVREGIATAMRADGTSLPWPPSQWVRERLDETRLRSAIASAAKQRQGKRDGWFKRADLAHDLAELAFRYVDDNPESELVNASKELHVWTTGYG